MYSVNAIHIENKNITLHIKYF